MIPKKCNNCASQYFCKLRDIRKKLDPKMGCKDFISWIHTKNYGEVKRIAKDIELRDNREGNNEII